ncbi:MAG: hypothetical protein ACRDZO_24895 [Egibacteraceae bacterium]
MPQQLAVRVPDQLEGERRHAIGEAIAEGYRRVPQTDEELEAVTVVAIRSIHEEPW